MKISASNNILIVGLGLIGGSYARALTDNGYSVIAIDTNENTIQYALDNKIISKGFTKTEDAINDIKCCDLTIFGLYPNDMLNWLSNYSCYLKDNSVITDVSGVKSPIVLKANELLLNNVEFVASHPMAGKEVSGVMHSDASIFKEANFIITPTSNNSEHAINVIQELATILKFKNISILSTQKHDEMIGFLSQLTHVIAVTLMNTNDNTHLVEYTGDSFRDLTRIAKINENLWSELFLLNKDVLLKEIDDFKNELDYFQEVLKKEDIDELRRLFIQSTNRRKLFDK